jgi:hypothetical protein
MMALKHLTNTPIDIDLAIDIDIDIAIDIAIN